MIYCKICNKEFDNLINLSKHLKSHKITTKEYYDDYMRKKDEGYCNMCHKETRFMGLTKGYLKHCSNKCQIDDPLNKEKLKTTMQRIYGASNNFLRPDVKETAHSIEANNKRKETNKQKYGVEFLLQSKEIREKSKQTMLDKYDVPYYCITDDCRTKLTNKETNQKKIETKKQHNYYTTSKLEEDFELFLIEHHISYKHNYKTEQYPFKCDFYLDELDIYIEINNFWVHNSHFYDKTDETDIQTLQLWEEKAKTNDFYKKAINVWTVRDIQKRDIAIKNNLNYIVLWTKQDIVNYKQLLLERNL